VGFALDHNDGGGGPRASGVGVGEGRGSVSGMRSPAPSERDTPDSPATCEHSHSCSYDGPLTRTSPNQGNSLREGGR
jgi:hypothetical protein